MNYWLKIGIIVSTALVALAVLSAGAFFWLADPASARAVSGYWGQGNMRQGFMASDERQFRSFDRLDAEFGRGGGQGGRFGQRGGPGGGLMNAFVNHNLFLADALGISVAELQTARDEARITAIQQAVDEDLITQSQADQMLLGGRSGFRGGPAGGRFGGADVDHQALLADALGVNVEELQTAQQEARTAAIQKAVEDGLITQAQADMMLAHMQLRDLIDPEALMAEALGITVEELQTARDEDKSLVELVDDLGLEAVVVRRAMTAAYQAAIQQAVDDGAITQAQADQILSRPGAGFGPGFGGRAGFEGPRDGFGPGRRGPGERGGFGNFRKGN